MLLDDAVEFEEADAGIAASGVEPVGSILDDLTMRVVELSRHDPVRSAFPQGSTTHLLSRFFGMHQPAPLADPRLEAVRRFCVLARHGDGRCSALRADLAEAGYDERQRRAIEAMLRNECRAA